MEQNYINKCYLQNLKIKSSNFKKFSKIRPITFEANTKVNIAATTVTQKTAEHSRDNRPN